MNPKRRYSLGPGIFGAALFFAFAVTGAFAGEVEWHGFVEGAVGVRTAEDAAFDGMQDYTLEETRTQLRLGAYGEQGEVFLRLDILDDQISGGGTGLEVRDGYLKFSTFGDHVDVKMGRQALTWGTGDLIFINDLFPKDWVSFFVGREDQYLKAPADAVRLGFFGLPFDVDLVLMPEFTPDRIPTGERLSFYTPPGTAGPPGMPANVLENGETAIRLSRYVGNFTASLYGYRGFFKTPAGMGTDGIPFYPKLSVAGASLRGGLAGGVAWLEGGYYDSRDDPDGDDPMVANSSGRFLAGFERQVATDFNVSLQWYGEWMVDHDSYAAGLPAGAWAADELRQIVTMRLEKMMNYQTVRLSLFTFYSPTDEDMHARALASYKVTDDVEVAAGANVFEGNSNQTLFGQLDGNDNVFTRVRYTF